MEALQTELIEAKEKLEELTLDYEIAKEQLEKYKNGSVGVENDETSGANSYEMKQLQQQNVRLRDTLVR